MNSTFIFFYIIFILYDVLFLFVDECILCGTDRVFGFKEIMVENPLTPAVPFTNMV